MPISRASAPRVLIATTAVDVAPGPDRGLLDVVRADPAALADRGATIVDHVDRAPVATARVGIARKKARVATTVARAARNTALRPLLRSNRSR